MQAIIISALDMWPVTSITTSTVSPPPSTTSNCTPYRPFEISPFGDEFRPNPFPSPEPPAPPPAALSPPLLLGGSQWTLSPPAEDRSSVDPVETVSQSKI
jgi:hypothetical protein